MSSIFNNNHNVRTITNADSISDNDDHISPVFTLTQENIYKSIPKSAVNNPDKKLETTHIEHRWRFFNINNRKLIEMSIKHPENNRKYINSSGMWINYNLDSKWDKYLILSKYYYTPI
jgi:hypothetical protein